MRIIDRIFELIKANKTNQATLAKNIGASTGLFTQWKKRVHCPSAEYIVKIASFFGVSSDYLLGLSEFPYVPENVLNGFTRDEVDLISNYRQLTPQSKQIVMTVSFLELNHIKASIQCETSIEIINRTKSHKKTKILCENCRLLG